MKTRRDIFGGLMLAAAALVCLTGCKKDDEGEKITLGVDFEQTAGMQKTYVGNGDRTIYWNTGDKVFVNGDDVEYTVKEGAVEVVLNKDGYAAVYPATGDNSLTYNGEVSGKNCTGGTVVIPATQNYTEKDGHQVLGGPMAARLDSKTGRLLFRNLYAVIKVTVQAGSTDFNLSSITVESTNEVNLAGSQAFSFNGVATNTAAPTLGKLTEGSGSTCVTLTFAKDTTIPASGSASFYLYTVPFSGANLTVKINGNMIDNPTTARDDVSISRSSLGNTTVNVTDLTNIEGCVDLGLSVLWATCNVGADNPWDYGDYFAWGETKSKTTYTWHTYSFYCKEDYPTSNDVFSMYTGEDGYTRLTSGYDVAQLGQDGRRMPTKTEFEELLDAENCTQEWQTNYMRSGIAGVLFTSKKTGYEGNSVFFPAAGCSKTAHVNEMCLYWSSDLCTTAGIIGGAWALHSSYDKGKLGISVNAGSRQDGFTVRPVMPKPTE